jgi:hypothetical protein
VNGLYELDSLLAEERIIYEEEDLLSEDESKDVEDSPYEEVRAAVSNTDDPTLPCVWTPLPQLTIRKLSGYG